MLEKNSHIPILIAEDDKDDRMFFQEAIKENGIKNKVIFVKDGEELMDYLKRKGDFADSKESLPGIIFLDVHLPKKDGLTALKEIKSDPKLKRMVVIMFSASGSPYDMVKCYDLGVNCYVTKPDTFNGLLEMLKKIKQFWLDSVEYA